MRGVELFAGVDGGGSKTLAVVVDAQGAERGRATAGSSNYSSVGLDRAIGAIGAALSEAAGLAGAALPLCAAWFGLAGVDRPADRAALLPRLSGPAGALRLTNDAELALTGLPGALGVAVIAGTGSIAVGRNAEGRRARAGGWGHLFGDEGSGYELGRLALQAAARAADGRGPATTLLGAILRHWSLSRPSDLIGRVYPDADRSLIAGLSPLVFTEARIGDRVARGLLERAAAELTLAAVTVGDELGYRERELPLALGGGLLIHNAGLRDLTLECIRSERRLGQVVTVPEPASSAARAAVELVAGTGSREA